MQKIFLKFLFNILNKYSLFAFQIPNSNVADPEKRRVQMVRLSTMQLGVGTDPILSSVGWGEQWGAGCKGGGV